VLVAEPVRVLRIVDPVSLADVSRCVFDHEKPSIGFAPRRVTSGVPVRVTRGAGSGQHLASVLQEGRKNANIDAVLGFIWRISAK
jgi:hypothetical protein